MPSLAHGMNSTYMKCDEPSQRADVIPLYGSVYICVEKVAGNKCMANE